MVNITENRRMPASLYSINLYDVLFMQKVYKKAKVPLTFLTLIKVFYTLKMAETKAKSPLNCQELSGKTHHTYLKCIQRFQKESQWEEEEHFSLASRVIS